MSLKTAQQLNYSKPLDVHTWSDYAEVNQFVNTLWDQFLAEQYLDKVGRGKRPLTSVKQQFKVLLLDLYVTWKTDSDLVIGVAMSNSAYQTSSRYNALHISPIMIDLVNSLVEMGLIEKHVGSELSGITTRIWTTPKQLHRPRWQMSWESSARHMTQWYRLSKRNGTGQWLLASSS